MIMADLLEAFGGVKFEQKNIKNIDYFFTQRNIKEKHEYLDKNMNRQYKKVNTIYNYLALNIPFYNQSKSSTFDVDIFGDSGYHYKGIITPYQGNIPHLMFPLKGDKKVFVHIVFNKTSDSEEEYLSFIEVPKRFQSIDINSESNKLQQDDDEISDVV